MKHSKYIRVAAVVITTLVLVAMLITTLAHIVRAKPLPVRPVSSQGAWLQPAAGTTTIQPNGASATSLQPAATMEDINDIDRY